jgi:rhodanese-related sulfurtransferase
MLIHIMYFWLSALVSFHSQNPEQHDANCSWYKFGELVVSPPDDGYIVCSAYVLNGGFPAWLAAGGPTESTSISAEAVRCATTAAALAQPGHEYPYCLSLQNELVKSMDDVKRGLRDSNLQVIDARSRERFLGKAPEPRPEIPSGHMPGTC